MRILAIDTSTLAVSVALLEADRVVHELDSREKADFRNENQITESGGGAGADDTLPPGYTRKRSKNGKKTSRVFPPGASVLLAPMLKTSFDQAGWEFSKIDLIAVAIGPGRFTGLRVGVVTAKSLAYANDIPIIGINSLEVIAAQTANQMIDPAKTIRSAINAQRGQLFAATYVSTGEWHADVVVENQVISQNEWLESLKDGDTVSGPGIKQIENEIGAKHPNVTVAPREFWETQARSVGMLALRKHKAGHKDDLWTISPLYFRPSSAEEIRAQRLEAK